MIALIDADLVAYRCAASAKNDPEEVAILRCDKLMRQLLEETQAESYRGFLSGGSNFRKKITPDYKANRKDEDRPQWLEACREFLIKEWKCELQDRIEADDALGINQTEGTVICSLDKDLLQIPGTHYSWEISTSTWVRPAAWSEVTYLDGIKHFWKQMLIGDTSDNVRGVDGLGPVRAKKVVDPCETEQEMLESVLSKYDSIDRFLVNGMCLWILREEGKTWLDHLNQLTLSDELKLAVDQMYESTKYLTGDTLMEPSTNL